MSELHVPCPTCGHEKFSACTCDPKWPAPEVVRHNARMLFGPLLRDIGIAPSPARPDNLPSSEQMAEYQRLKR